jgi:hypothetical protein
LNATWKLQVKWSGFLLPKQNEMKERKAFKFYRSYFEVANELPDKERLEFLWALLKKQFENVDPDLTGLARFAYVSQEHSIKAQMEGYISKVSNPTQGGAKGGTKGGSEAPEVQEKEKEKEKVQEKEERTTKRGSKKLILNESELKFIDWFNAQFIPVLNRKGKFNSMTATDRNNLIALKESYPNAYDWEHAFTVMTQSEWVIENNMATIAHFLRHDNFTKYVNQQIKQTKYKAPWD